MFSEKSISQYEITSENYKTQKGHTYEITHCFLSNDENREKSLLELFDFFKEG